MERSGSLRRRKRVPTIIKENENFGLAVINPDPQHAGSLSPIRSPHIGSYRNGSVECDNSRAQLPRSNTINTVTRAAFKTKVGRCSHKPKDHNQDSFIIRPALQGFKGHYIFAVCDGHGTYGHSVSTFIRNSFPPLIEKSLKLSTLQTSIEKSINRAISKLSIGLLKSGIEIAFSGSTLISVLLFGSLCVCANVGDSRAVLGRLMGDEWEALGLSQDHSLTRDDEKRRVLEAGGRVGQAADKAGNLVGPERVWLKDADVPGLAMTRSIGDKVAKSCGVIDVPEVMVRRLTVDDKFIILASDGLWEKVSNEEAVRVVSGFYIKNQVEEAAVELVKIARREGKRSGYVDDITVIVMFLAVNV